MFSKQAKFNFKWAVAFCIWVIMLILVSQGMGIHILKGILIGTSSPAIMLILFILFREEPPKDNTHPIKYKD